MFIYKSNKYTTAAMVGTCLSLFAHQHLKATDLVENNEKIRIVGGGIAGAVEAYFAHLHAQKNGTQVRITIYDKNKSLQDTTVCHIVPSLTPDEIISVVPRGQDLVNSLGTPFSDPGGIRVDDVPSVKNAAAERFIEEAKSYSQDEEGHKERTQTLLAFGKTSMDLWQTINESDGELKTIMRAANFNPCREPKVQGERKLHDGYRIDLIYNVDDAMKRANKMKSDYRELGYNSCDILSPQEVRQLDPSLGGFIDKHSINDTWQQDTVAIWRPGGCLDTQVFLPKFYNYLEKKMGTYINKHQKVKNNFQMKFDREVSGITLDHNPEKTLVRGIKFKNGTSKEDKALGKNVQYVFCPGEAVGTLASFGLKEPAYARFAGASLMLNIPIPSDQISACKAFNHCMEVHQEGVVLAWQARFIEEENKVFIGVAGTKAFYSDIEPRNDQAFAIDRNLLQLNMINDVLPQFISLALGRDTKGQKLTDADMKILEDKQIADRWVGTRAVSYDGFPTLGAAYTKDGKKISNARITTHLSSGGVSFSPAAVAVSRFVESPETLPDSLKDHLETIQNVVKFSDSGRVASSIQAN
jgi:glycine/D-amino acid oxidase-like deaminating enzyme